VTSLVTSSLEKYAFACSALQSAFMRQLIVNERLFSKLQFLAAACGNAENQFRKLLLYPPELRGHFWNRRVAETPTLRPP
jgi:hypothetical protein